MSSYFIPRRDVYFLKRSCDKEEARKKWNLREYDVYFYGRSNVVEGVYKLERTFLQPSFTSLSLCLNVLSSQHFPPHFLVFYTTPKNLIMKAVSFFQFQSVKFWKPIGSANYPLLKFQNT